MNYKFLKISRYYIHYINYFRQHHSVGGMSYTELLNEYLNDSYIYGDSYSHYLREKGNQVFEIIFNDEIIQNKWADEHCKDCQRDMYSIIEEQIKHIKPDVIFWDGMENYDFVEHIKETYPSVKVHFSQIGVPINNMRRFSPYNFVITCLKPHVETLNRNGKDAYFIRHGFDPRINKKLVKQAKNIPFSFSGSIYSGNDAHMERARYIQYLMKESGLKVFTSFRNPGNEDKLKHIVKKSLGSFHNLLLPVHLKERMREWKRQPGPIMIDSNSAKQLKPPVFGLDMFNVLSQSQITLNVHIDIAGTHAASIRMYEATGVGTCLLTDYKEDLKAYFEPDSEVVVFRNKYEAAEKYRYLQNHPDEIARIADKGKQRTLKDHSIALRVEEIDNIIHKYL